jgi:hypothetical protein
MRVCPESCEALCHACMSRVLRSSMSCVYVQSVDDSCMFTAYVVHVSISWFLTLYTSRGVALLVMLQTPHSSESNHAAVSVSVQCCCPTDSYPYRQTDRQTDRQAHAYVVHDLSGYSRPSAMHVCQQDTQLHLKADSRA